MTKHRLLACLLVLCLLLGCVPAGLAEGGSVSSSELVQLLNQKLNKGGKTDETPAEEAPVQEAPAAEAEDDEEPVSEVTPKGAAALPVFIMEPSDRQARASALTVMEADVEGASSYQWEYSSDNGLTWKNCPSKTFSGVRTTRILFTVKTTMDGWLFRLAATNSAGTAYSREALKSKSPKASSSTT